MSKELTIRPNQEIVEVGNRIDKIVNECLPAIAQENQNFVQALTLANGIKALRNIFKTDLNIKETVTSMQNTHLGFMTDRTDLAIWKSQQSGSKKEVKPYRYEDVAEVCIEAMLKGYRITNNEFNMLVGRFYPAKNGKFRRIQECEGVTDFQFTTTSPAYESERGGVQYAKVQAFASWKKDGQLATLGSSTAAEDRLTFKIKVNNQMGEDAIVGKALSKLFSRVLMRLEGKIMPESTDVDGDDVAEIESGASDLTDKIKESKAGAVVDAEFKEEASSAGNALAQDFEKLVAMELGTFGNLHDKGIKNILPAVKQLLKREDLNPKIEAIIRDKFNKKPEWAALLEPTREPGGSGSGGNPFTPEEQGKPSTTEKHDAADQDLWNGLNECPEMDGEKVPRQRCQGCIKNRQPDGSFCPALNEAQKAAIEKVDKS